MLRLFAAIAVPDDVAECLTPLQMGLEGARWVPRKNFHVTLKFFGDVTEPLADELDSALRQLRVKPFTLDVSSLAAFGEGDDMRSVYAAIAPCERLSLLAQKVATISTDILKTRDKRKFVPHITLGRMRRGASVNVADWIECCGRVEVPSFEVTHFTLYSSHTRPDGAVYTPERHYIL